MKRMIAVLSALLFAGFNGCSEAPRPLPPAPQPPVQQPVTINIYLNSDSQSVQPVQPIRTVERIYLDGGVQPAECQPVQPAESAQPLVQVSPAGGAPAEVRPVITRPLINPNPVPGVPPVAFNPRGRIVPAVPGRQPRRAVSPAATEPQVTIPAQPIPAQPPQRFQIRDF